MAIAPAASLFEPILASWCLFRGCQACDVERRWISCGTSPPQRPFVGAGNFGCGPSKRLDDNSLSHLRMRSESCAPGTTCRPHRGIYSGRGTQASKRWPQRHLSLQIDQSV